jgi:hypothetical protein
MPNYMHGIIVLNDVRATLAVAQNDLLGLGQSQPEQYYKL